MQQVNVGGTDRVLGASFRAGVPRTVYVSSVVALGASGYAPEPAAVADETHRPDGRHLSPYNRSKAEAHRVALAWRAKGLPLVIALPNAVVGANDHSIFGYFLRMHLAGVMSPVAFGGDSTLAFVDVHALAEGVCLAADSAPIGEDYIFSGEPITIREMFDRFSRYPGGMKVQLQLPRWFMRPPMVLLEPLQRAVGLPAILSRDMVDQSRGHFNFTSAKAHRDLSWTHAGTNEMWDRIIRSERELMAKRTGLRNRLRHQSVVDDAAD
jgi:nucleoside-diphosphate-sugar epimerase